MLSTRAAVGYAAARVDSVPSVNHRNPGLPGGEPCQGASIPGIQSVAKCQRPAKPIQERAFLARFIAARAHFRAKDVDGGTAAYQRIIGGLSLTAVVLFLHRLRKPSVPKEPTAPQDHPWRRAWPWVIANALAGPAIGVAFYQWALAEAPTGVVLSIVATTPLVVIPFTMVLDGEHPTRRSLLGGAVAVLGAAALAYK